jgi:hypothetical protein
MIKTLIKMVNWLNGGEFKLYELDKRLRYFEILDDLNLSNLEKCLRMSDMLTCGVTYTSYGYDILNQHYLSLNVISLASLLDSLQSHRDWLNTHDGYCYPNTMHPSNESNYLLGLWALDGMDKYNYINLLVGWERAGKIINSISKYSYDNVWLSYVNRAMHIELTAYLKLSKFILEVIVHEPIDKPDNGFGVSWKFWGNLRYTFFNKGI